jgi:hypothetical protein
MSDDELCLSFLQQSVDIDSDVIKLVFGGAACLPPPDRDRERFIGTLKLVITTVGVVDEIGLYPVRDFALAEAEIDYWSAFWSRILYYKRSAYLTEQIEAGLRQEGVSEPDIKEKTKIFKQQYLDLKTRRDVMDRFKLPGPEQIDVEITQSEWSNLTKVDQRITHHKRQRDQAIRSLDTYNKMAARRMREMARNNDQSRPQIGDQKLEPALALT